MTEHERGELECTCTREQCEWKVRRRAVQSGEHGGFHGNERHFASSVESTIVSAGGFSIVETLVSPRYDRSFSASTCSGPGFSAFPGSGCGNAVDRAVWNVRLPS